MVRGWIASVVVPNIVLGVALARVAAAQCVPGGPGGFIPTSGSGGGGSWPTSFPSLPLTSTLAVTVPPGATVLTSVRLHTLVHGWMGQLQIVLESPQMQEFRKMLFSKIVPNVKRLGLLTPYVRERFAELGILQFENEEPSA